MMRRTALPALLLSGACLSVAARGADKPSQQAQRAMKEMWRRGTCLLSSVHKPAAREAAEEVQG